MQNRRRLTKGQRKDIYAMTDGHCAYCGCDISMDEMQIDHVKPLRKGGADAIHNMLPSCRSCNHCKSTLDIDQFRQMIEKMPKTLMRDATYRNAVRFGLVEPKPRKVVFYFEWIKKVNL